MKFLSIVIPAFNEENTILPLLARISVVATEEAGFAKEIIVVDDGSTDGTASLLSKVQGIRHVRQDNQGKGAAVQRGIKECTGDFVIVQDADLEYDPNDYLTMLRKLVPGKRMVVYGSRPLGQLELGRRLPFPGKHPEQSFGAWLANGILSFWILLLYGRWLSDPLTAYKLYPLQELRSLHVKTRGFETDHELTAKMIRRGLPIVEVPVSYIPRSRAEGKKIKASDGFIAMWTLLKFRFVNPARF